jgi:dihydrofolate synthase / folylpolyglutamate synthase
VEAHYTRALDDLFRRTRGLIKPGLERTVALLQALGNPQLQVPAIHVAGTNGKGSTVAMVEALLRSRGPGVGVYTSPHLVDFCERVRIDDRYITPDEVTAFLDRWMPEIERLGATFFEATTAMALDHFARRGARVVVLETGLGGRLDSTNVVTPLAAGVTGIALDHMELLGGTLEAIAREKGGIFKLGRPAVVGETDPARAAMLLHAARAAGAAPIHDAHREYPLSGIRVHAGGTTAHVGGMGGGIALTTPLYGAHQASNALCAWLLAGAAGPGHAVALESASEALGAARLPGRFHRAGRWILDVAHNPAGAAVLASTLRAVLPPGARPAMLLSVMGDKDWRGIVDALAPVAGTIVLTTAPSVPAERVWAISDVLAHASQRGCVALAEPDFDRALALAHDMGDPVVVTGSFHTVGDAMSRLQLDPLVR